MLDNNTRESKTKFKSAINPYVWVWVLVFFSYGNLITQSDDVDDDDVDACDLLQHSRILVATNDRVSSGLRNILSSKFLWATWNVN